jgi:hypothetical protein
MVVRRARSEYIRNVETPGIPKGDNPYILPSPLHVDRRLDVTWKLSRRDATVGESLKAVVVVRNLAEESLEIAYSKVVGGVTRPGHDSYVGVATDAGPGVVRRTRIAPGERVEIDALVGTTPVEGVRQDSGDYVAVGALYLGIGSSRTKAIYVVRAPVVLHTAAESTLGAFA